MAYKSEFQSNNADLQSILDIINTFPDAPEPSDSITITISGEGYEDDCHAIIGNTIYTSDASGIEVMTGDIITFCVCSNRFSMMANAVVEIDGTVVVQASSANSRPTYDWTIPEGIISIAIVFEYNGMYSRITVTTTRGNNSSNSTEENIFVPTNSGGTTYKSKFADNNIDLERILEMIFAKFILTDFEYINNGNGTYTLTDWKGTLNGVPSTELVIPDNSRIIL